jgi:2-oxoglutarate ferredoxin oxidoreductase subunit alpha
MDRVNDFAFKIATANGTGSASANGLLMQSIFRMGIPVTGKNVFPSNIQGLPTWYEIRVSKDGYTARTPHFDLMVRSMRRPIRRTSRRCAPAATCCTDSTWPLDDKLQRPDVTYLGVPLAEMCNAAFKGVRERILMKNIAYVGALADCCRSMPTSSAPCSREFGKKPALMNSNQKARRSRLRLRDERISAVRCRFIRRWTRRRTRFSSTQHLGGHSGHYPGPPWAAWYPDHPVDLR